MLAGCSTGTTTIPRGYPNGKRTLPVGAGGVARSPLDTSHGFKVLYAFRGKSDGGGPESGVAVDSQGVLYGTTSGGGAYDNCGFYKNEGCGTIFRLTPTASGYVESVLYNFDAHRAGVSPWAGVTLDPSGALYSATQGSNGTHGCGTVLKLTASKYSKRVVHRLNQTIGCDPLSTMVLGNDGALYGTTNEGGRDYSGTVFKVALSGNRPVERLLLEFRDHDLADGMYPFAGVTLDGNGAIYGTTNVGGSPSHCGSYYVGCGIVFRLTPSGSRDSRYKETVIHSFAENEGARPYGGLALDKTGAIYGTTTQGGGTSCGTRIGCGTVFKLTPSGSTYTATVLYEFGESGHADGYNAMGALSFGKKGVLYGTTYWGGNQSCSCGTVFQLAPSAGGYKETILHRFSGPDGCEPRAGLTERKGILYGTTSSCASGGTVFQLTP
jgi:uncharacterized repeat protein (TIGR03803 family)